jgi:ABC-type multidrug transport system ATPase subunit
LDKIVLENTAKRYIKEWVFRNFSFTFERNNAYVIQGSNGSGKSTLLQTVSSYLSPSKGKVTFFDGENPIENEIVYHHISMATPYMELPEEFTLSEVVDFHLKFKEFYQGISKDDFISICYLEDSKNKIVRNFSSGMKQRLKLGLAILSKSNALFLDEPTSNMDERGINWYKDLIVSYLQDRIVVVCSNNIESEFFFCTQQIHIEDYKKK